MTAASLTPLVFLLTGGAWASFIVLGRAASHRPRIGALTERAFIAFVIAALGTIACVIVLNTDSGRPYFDSDTASFVFRAAMLVVLSIPSAWLLLWLTGRLGQGE